MTQKLELIRDNLLDLIQRKNVAKKALLCLNTTTAYEK